MIFAALKHIADENAILARQDLVPLEQTTTGWVALHESGSVVFFDDGDELSTVPSLTKRTALLARFALRYPLALAFLPLSFPVQLCGMCKGTGANQTLPAELADRIVCQCGGVGWQPTKDEPILRELRHLARAGSSLKNLLDYLHQELNVSPYSRGLVMHWFSRAFRISPTEFHEVIFAWTAFGDGATIDDEIIEARFRRHLPRWLNEGDADPARTCGSTDPA